MNDTVHITRTKDRRLSIWMDDDETAIIAEKERCTTTDAKRQAFYEQRIALTESELAEALAYIQKAKRERTQSEDER
jgi:hypothetical protein